MDKSVQFLLNQKYLPEISKAISLINKSERYFEKWYERLINRVQDINVFNKPYHKSLLSTLTNRGIIQDAFEKDYSWALETFGNNDPDFFLIVQYLYTGCLIKMKFYLLTNKLIKYKINLCLENMDSAEYRSVIEIIKSDKISQELNDIKQEILELKRSVKKFYMKNNE